MPASGHQDHTPSPSASGAVRQERQRVHRIPTRIRDDRETPLVLGRDQIALFLFLPARQEQFLKIRNRLAQPGAAEPAMSRPR